MGPSPSREDVSRARGDLGAFGDLVGCPLEVWQRDSLALQKRQTVLVSPRQCGKSRSLSLLALWWAYRKPGQMVLVVSAGDEAAGRLLRMMQTMAEHLLLAGSVVDETAHRLVLTNGSEIRSVPASERQVRGWSVDLLLVDEAAFVSEDLLVSAALPTTSARPEARIVLASSPWGDAGPFRSLAMAGEDPGNPHTRTYRWKLADAWWISGAVVESARATMSPLRFRAEYEGEWVPAGDAYFDAADLAACVADFPLQRLGDGGPAVAGLDWGRQRDAHAVALAGLCDDYGVNGRPVVAVPWVETSRRPYGAQVDEVAELAEGWVLEAVLSETNGVGAYPTEDLVQRLPRVRVVPIASSQGSKEDAYGRAALMLAERAIVLPQHAELLRQMAGVAASPTPSGGLRIAARKESIHDDLPDALSLAVAGLPRELARVPLRDVPGGTEWAETPDGIRIPLPVRTMEANVSYRHLYGAMVKCPGCSQYRLAASPACQWCGLVEQGALAQAEAPAAAAVPAGPVPEVNRYLPGAMRCPQGHLYPGDVHGDRCPRCPRGLAVIGGRLATAVR